MARNDVSPSNILEWAREKWSLYASEKRGGRLTRLWAGIGRDEFLVEQGHGEVELYRGRNIVDACEVYNAT